MRTKAEALTLAVEAVGAGRSPGSRARRRISASTCRARSWVAGRQAEGEKVSQPGGLFMCLLH